MFFFLNVITFSDSQFIDNHDIISLKLYQLTVLRSKKEEEEEEEEITIPSVDNFELLRCKTHTHTHIIVELHESSCHSPSLSSCCSFLHLLPPPLSSLHPPVFLNSLPTRSLTLRLPSSLPVGQTEEGMSGIAIFFTVLFTILGSIFLVVICLVVYGHWNESRRKRFY